MLVNGGEQAEMWGTFRVARRPTIAFARQGLSNGTYRFEGAYRPYHDRRVLHSRTIVRGPEGLEISDRLEGVTDGEAESFLHLHPDFTLRSQGRIHVASAAGIEIEVESWGGESVQVVRGQATPPQGWYCPEFGVALPAPVLVMSIRLRGAHEFGFRIRPRVV